MRLSVSVPELRERVESWLLRPQGEVLKDNRVRSVHRWQGLIVKRNKYPGLVQTVRGFMNDRAAHEFRLLERFLRKGIDAPEPVAWARVGGSTYLFTREVPGAQPLRFMALGRPLIRGLARFVRRIHDAGFRHDDLHVGNVLSAGGKLFLVDAHRAADVGRLTRAERVASLAFVVMSIYERVSETDVLRLIREYGADPAEVRDAFRAARERYYLDRQSRVWKTGSDFQVSDGLALRRPYGPEEARRALAAPPMRTVKGNLHRRLWLVDAGTFVKERAGRLWYNAFGLETRGIPTPRLLACSGDRVVGCWIEGSVPLWDHLRAHGVSHEILRGLARLVRKMHDRGVWHYDLKQGNLLVRGTDLHVVDVDRVTFLREVHRGGRIHNLAQLNASIGAPVTRTDRLRFFRFYAGRNRAMRMGWKEWVREIMEKTRARRHAWP